MAIEFDPSQPFQVVEGETLDSLTAPRTPRRSPTVSAPVGPVFDPSLPFTPVADAPAGPTFDPSQPVIKMYGLEEFAAKPVEELIADKDFMPIEFGKQFETGLDPVQRTKLEQVYAARESSGTSVADKVRSAFTGIFPAVKTLGEGVKSAAKLAQKFTPVGIAKRVIEQSPQEVINDYAKSATEAAASVELAALGSTDLIRRSTRAVGEAVGLLPGDLPAIAAASGVPVRKAKADMTEQDWRTRLSDDIAAARQVETAGQGNGAVMQGLGIDAATLEKDFGIRVDPEEIARLSVVTDPINYVPLGATVGAVTKLGGKAVRLGVAATRTTEQAAKLANILNTATAAAGAMKSGAVGLAGDAAKALGGAMEKTGLATGKVVGPVGLMGGTGIGALLGGNVYSAFGLAAGAQAIPQALLRGGRALKAGGKILTGEIKAPAALTLAGDTLKAGATGAIKGAAEGGVLILPFEIGARPEEEGQLLGMVGLGAVTRAGAEGVRPGARTTGRAAQNKLAESIFRRVEQEPLPESPTYGTDPLLDSTHAANVSKLAPSEQKLVSWGRELLRAAGGEIYVLDNTAFNRETGSKTAHGYAVNIGEKIAPDGSSTPVFRIFLNQSAEAMPHEFFHALTDLDPKRAAAFRDTVKASLTPDQLKSFEQLYNSRLNNGLPEVQWKRRLTPEQVANEAAAETFSRLFLAQDLTGVEPKVQQKAALFVSSLLEKLGAPLGKVGAKAGEAGVSTLGIRPGAESAKIGQAWVQNLVKRVNDEGTLGQPPIAPERAAVQTPIPADVVRAKPATVPPAPAAPVPTPSPTVPAPVNPPLPAVPAPTVRNIRTTRAAQDDFAGQRAAVTNVDPAKAAAAATGDANTIARVDEISALIESGSPVVEIEHSGARAEGTAAGRTVRRAEQEAAYIAEGLANAPQPIREAYQKVFVPVRWEVVAGKPQLLAMSLDKVIANTHKAVKESAARGVEARIPYEITDGRLTDNAWGQFVDDLKSYAENQSNGYRGDGQKLIRPTTDVGLSIPAENPAYNPRPITEERANFLNLVQGLNPPLTAREGRQSSAIVPGNVKGQILAEANLRTPERPSVIRPEDITKQDFKSQPGRSIAETNPLRNELAAAGVPVRELIEVTERINARDINSVRPRPELEFKAPVTDTIRGGFLPGDTAKQISDVQAMSGDEFTAATKSWDGGLTKQAWKVGLEVTTPEDVLALKVAQEDATAKAQALRAEKKTSEAFPWIYKSQFFREAYEAATDTLSAAGENGWRSAFPDREAPFPETAPKGDFMPSEPSEEVRSIASKYATDAGIDKTPHTSYDEVNVPLAKKLAEFYDAAKDSPEDPAVQASYQALADETLAQYQAIKDAGYTIEPFTGEGEPYKSSAEMVADVRDNKHLFFLKTEGNFTGAEANPMLRPGPDGLLVNDVFRAVHDFFGHAKEGYQFGPRGEFNAWKAHSTMFTDAAQGSLAAETLAQNSWVNYGKHLKEGTPLKDRPFAEQKNVIVPDELIAEARGDFLPDKPMPGSIEEYDARTPRKTVFPKAKKSAATSKQSKSNPTGWILPTGEVKPLTTSFHEQDLADNSASYNKKFGTKFTKDPNKIDRVEALNAGFVRMRYEPANGRMAVEVGASSWSKQKAKVLDTLLSQSGKIDTLAINLIDENGKAVDSVADKVFNAENRDAAITDLVNEIMPPKVTRAKGVGPSDIQRMRALPGAGDFLPAEPFYSELQRVIDEKVKGDSIPAKDLAALVRNAGVKPEELKWSGLDDYLKGKQKVSVPELKKFLAENSVQLEEVVKGESLPLSVAQNNLTGGKWFVVNDETGMPASPERFSDRSDALDHLREMEINKGLGGDTKFQNYQVPGGENYRELLLTLPGQFETWRTVDERGRTQGEGFDKDYAQNLVAQHKGWRIEPDGGEERGVRDFTSSHFDEPNVLAHVRFNERTDSAGKKVLFLEEVQSDWHQAGKKKGYATGEKLQATEAVRGDGFWRVNDEQGAFVSNVLDYDLPAGADAAAAIAEANRRITQEPTRVTVGNQVPDAPFKKTWPLLAVKRMIRYAAENGFDKVAWTPGDVQAARYDLSKQVKAIEVYRHPNDVFVVSADTGSEATFSREVKGLSELESLVGKDIAKKVETLPENKSKVYSGDDLKVGGEGMRGFYDQILPKEVGAYVKKWGAKVEKLPLTPREATFSEWRKQTYPGRDATPAMRKEYAALNLSLVETPVWSVTLTPSMRSDVLTKGQKMFLPKGEAAVPSITPDSITPRRTSQPLPPITADDLEPQNE